MIAALILVLVAPITLYRATQQRIDERACFNQVRAIDGTQRLLSQYGVAEIPDLTVAMAERRDRLVTERATLEASASLTDDQKGRLSEIRREERQLRREFNAVEDFKTVSAKDRFDCLFIDDFPTLARIDPPVDVTYRRVPDEDAIAQGRSGATKVVKQVKDPVEGRTVNIFTYTAESIDIGINFLRAQYAGIFDALTNVLRQSLIGVEVAFMLTPWPVVVGLAMILAWA
ncbi:MAG: hypothetical protein OXI66_19060, partial [Boseongicola sp.]|nr:hypothetical protein [Boseongicola sp.]